jgi:hypothetical protein
MVILAPFSCVGYDLDEINLVLPPLISECAGEPV